MNHTEFIYFLNSPLHEQCSIFLQLTEQDLEALKALILKHPDTFSQSSLLDEKHPLWCHLEPMITPYIREKVDMLERGYRQYSTGILQNLEEHPTLVPLYLREIQQRDLWQLRTFKNDMEALFYDQYHHVNGTTPSRYQKAADLFEKHFYGKEQHRQFFHTMNAQELRSVSQHVSQTTLGAIIYHAWETEDVFGPGAEMLLGIPENIYWKESIVDSDPVIMHLSSLGAHLMHCLKNRALNRFYPDPLPYLHDGHRLSIIAYCLEQWTRFPEKKADFALLQRFSDTPLQLDAFYQWYEEESLLRTLPEDYKKVRDLPLLSLPLTAWGISLPTEHPHFSLKHLPILEEISFSL